MSVSYLRWKPGQPRESRVLGPLSAEHPAAQFPCLCCGQSLSDGRPVQLLAVGPDEETSRAECRQGAWHAALALTLHAECIGTPAQAGTGVPQPVPVTLRLTPVDAGNLEAMVYAGFRKLRDDCTPEARAMARDVLNQVLDAIKPLLAMRDASDG